MAINERLYELSVEGAYRSLTFRANDKGRRGASGFVLELACESGKVAKIYHSHERSKFEPKVRTMLKVKYRRPHTDRFDLAWPEALIVNHSGEFHGFKMPFFGSDCVDLELLIQAAEAEKEYGLGERDRLIIAANLAMAVGALHHLKVYCIDLKPENIRVNLNTKSVAIIDCDGMSIVDISVKTSSRFYADKCTPEYVAPEYMDLRPHRFTDEEQQDRFSLAIIIFMLLNRGLHPYTGTSISNTPDCETTAGKIKNNLYPFGNGKGRITPHKHFLYPFLPALTQQLFDRAFSGPKSRPSANEWLDHLDYLIGKAGTCSPDPMHVKLGTMGCPICSRDAHKIANLPPDFIAPPSLIGPANATSAPLPTTPRPIPTPPIASMSQVSAGTQSLVRGSHSVLSVAQPLIAHSPSPPSHAQPSVALSVLMTAIALAGGLALYSTSGSSLPPAGPSSTPQPAPPGPMPNPLPPPPPAPPRPQPISPKQNVTVFAPLGPQSIPLANPPPVFRGREPTNGWSVFSWRGGRWVLPPPPSNTYYHYLCDVSQRLMWCSSNPPNNSARPCTRNTDGQKGWCWVEYR